MWRSSLICRLGMGTLLAAFAAAVFPQELVSILERMELERVRGSSSARESAAWAEAVLPGAESGEILWTAECPTSAAEPVCGWLGELVEDLRRTPLRRDLRIVLLSGSSSAESWLAQREAPASELVLAAVHHAVHRSAGPAPILHDLPVEVESGRRMAPGWLVHAVLRGGAGIGRRPAVDAPVLSVAAQLVVRATRPERLSAAQTLLRDGIPAVTLSDRSVLTVESAASGVAGDPGGAGREAWTSLSAAAVRRLDALAGRPRFEDRYLAVLGRVWLPRDLYWIGFILWCLLVLRGLPGRWRGATGADRRARGRAYLSGLAFRVLFLLTLFTAPVFALPLLAPAGIAALLPPARRGLLALQRGVGLLPSVVFAAVLALALARGGVAGLAPLSPTPLLIGGSLAAFWLSLGGDGTDPPAAA